MAMRFKAFIIDLIDSWELLASESLVADDSDKQGEKLASQNETMIPPFV
ncbi:hypothetical protein [Marinobacterium lutimaris]|uniref:Uncharacterized protein n=1 Tax=Marinobacterium lutimaris TaxID=568106 RepID=A0A1H6DPN8_9GAMM|nr:hypothetical protein [Marinobacterium lutimaris]SEG87181.1 hypothetical protein SAMN05444390_10847 [Marinobacterium lutimaris]